MDSRTTMVNPLSIKDSGEPLSTLVGTRAFNFQGTDSEGLAFALEGKIRAPEDGSLPIMWFNEDDTRDQVGAMFMNKDTDVGYLRFSRSAKGQQAMRNVARGELQPTILKYSEGSKAGQPVGLSLQPIEMKRKDDDMEISSTEPLATPNPLSAVERTFSLGNAIRAELKGDWSEAGFEREMCQEAKQHYIGSAKGLVVPSSAVYQRAVMTSTGDIGGGIGSVHLSGSYIDIPREASSVMEAGATMIAAPQGTISIPKLNSDVSASFIAENSAITETDLDIDTITMTPRLCAGTASFTRHVLETADPRVDALVRENLQFRITNAIDEAALTGDGTGANPTGVENATGIETFTTTGGSTITHAESYEIIGEVASNNIDTAGGVWIINPASAATLASTAKDSGSGLFVYENGQMAGKRVIESAHCPSANAFFGMFRHLYIGMFGGMDLVIDPYSSARNGVIEITASQLTDVAVAHAGAFNKVTLTP